MQSDRFPLLERERELRQLADAYGRADLGEGHTVLIGGEAGIGKTTLVERFLRNLPPGCRLLIGACDPLATPTPLGPLFDMAHQVGGVLASRLESTAPRQSLFTSVLDVVSGSGGVTVLFIEDVHWADNATLDLIKFLARRASNMKVLMIFTYRDDENGPTHPLRPLQGFLANQRNVVRLTLVPLSVQAVAALLGDRPEEAKDVYRKTGGNPFFVTELISHGVDRLSATTPRPEPLGRPGRCSPSSLTIC
jgi:predicted ATPase